MPSESAPTTMESLTTNVAPAIGGGELLNMGLSVAIVVVAILLLGWFYSKSRVLSASGSDLIQIVAMRALGPKERLIVVEVAEQQLLLGMTATGVQTLHVLDRPVTVPTVPEAPATFAARLRSSLREMRR